MNLKFSIIMQKYRIIKQIGEGAFSIVYLAELKKTGQIVAIKKHKAEFPNWEETTSLRQLTALTKIKHECIVKLFEVIRQENNLWMIFQYAEGNLDHNSKSRILTERKIKQIIFQIACGLQIIHSQGLVHRDIKPQNILVKNNFIKIADFGLARQYTNIAFFTQYISTRWYRAPQLIIEMRKYGCGVDIFALGCVMTELYNGKPLFPGESQLEQFYLVFNRLQTPRKSQWPQFYRWSIKKGIEIKQNPRASEKRLIERQIYDRRGEELLHRMLKTDPHQRASAKMIIEDGYFDEIRNNFVDICQKKVKKKIEDEPFMMKKKLKTKTLSTASIQKIFSTMMNRVNEEEKEKKKKQNGRKLVMGAQNRINSLPLLNKINSYRKRKLQINQNQDSKIQGMKKSFKENKRRQNREKSRAQYFYCPLFLDNRRKTVSKIELNEKKKFKISSIRKSTEVSKQHSMTKNQNPYYI